jgi:hypothetical protein
MIHSGDGRHKIATRPERDYSSVIAEGLLVKDYQFVP